jgi:hypothetical protein
VLLNSGGSFFIIPGLQALTFCTYNVDHCLDHPLIADI